MRNLIFSEKFENNNFKLENCPHAQISVNLKGNCVSLGWG